MALKRDIYRALEDTVGPENVSEEPAVLDSYAWRSGLVSGLDKFVPNEIVEGEMATAVITVIPSNQDDSGNEVAPVYQAAGA